MDNPILATKLTIPRRQPSLLDRPRLLDLMSQGESALTLVSAAAGSGKTTLLADWAASSDDGSVGWLSLDAEDDRFDRFWTYLIASLQTVTPDIGSAALPLIGRSPTPAITSLLNDLAALDAELRLVLDDYHVIASADIHEAVAHFIDHLPENMGVVITTRSDPALPLAKWRARGQLTEIRVSDLHFTTSETDTYLTDLMGIPLTRGQLSALEQRTEGWAAALQLAALSMKGLDDVDDFVSGFAGTERYVVDYLVEEVLDRQPEDVRDFLMHTSILSRLTGALCDAVTGGTGGAAMLDRLERDNLLIVPIDTRRQWYRYHHLFADVLEARLRAEQPDRVATLHRRAADWHEGAGNPSEAIRHALAARDHDHAADLVEMAVPAQRRSRDEATMLSWFDALPADLFTHRPVLSVGYVGALLASGRTDRVGDLLDGAERWVGADPSQFVVANQDELGRLPSAVALYRSGLALMTGDVDTAVTHATRAFDLAGPEQPLERGGAAGLLALTHWSRGQLDAAFDRWASAVDSLGRAGHHSDMAGCSISMADIRITQGRLSDAVAVYEQGLASATADGEIRRGAADMHVGLGEIFRERNDLDSARSHLQRAQELGDGNGLPQNLYRSRLLEARILEAEGDTVTALDLVAEAKQVYFTDFSPDVRPMAAVEARMLLRAGRLAEARRWAEQSGLSLDDTPGYLNEFGHITLARVGLADGQDVGGFLERLLVSAESGERTANVIDSLIVLALARDDAAILGRAVALAEPEGFTRVFLDEGDRLVPLLRAVASSPDAPAHAEVLAGLTSSQQSPGHQGLIDPLTDRELEVLRLLSTDLTGPDIARELYVSLNTLRSHTKSIYLKLGVGNRRAAVRRAGELGLL